MLWILKTEMIQNKNTKLDLQFTTQLKYTTFILTVKYILNTAESDFAGQYRKKSYVCKYRW